MQSIINKHLYVGNNALIVNSQFHFAIYNYLTIKRGKLEKLTYS